MEIFIILLSAAVSAGISLFFKNKKEDNPLAKVRNYSNSRIQQFDEYFKEKSHELNATGAELDAKQTMATAAINRFEKQLSEFQQKIGNLSAETALLDNLKNKASEYERSIKNLTEMSAAVEENLSRIQKASSIIDKVTSRFETQNHLADSVEKKVNSVVAEFTKKNEERLKAIGTELLNQYQASAQKLSSYVSESEKKVDAILQKLNSDITQAYKNAALKAQQLEDTAFKSLEEKSNLRCESYKKALETMSAEMQNELNASAESFKKQLAETSASIKTLADSIALKNAGNEKLMETLNADFGAKSIEFQKKYELFFENAITDAARKEKSAYEKYIELTRQNLENYKKSAEEKIGAVHTSISEKIFSFNNSVNNTQKLADEKLLSVENFVNEKTELIDAVIEAKINSINEKISQIQQAADDKVEQTNSSLDSKLDSVNEKIALIEKAVEEKTIKVNSDADLKFQSINEKYLSIEKDFDGKVSNANAVVDEKLLSVKEKIADAEKKSDEKLNKVIASLASFDSRMSDFQKDMEYRLSAMELSGKDIEAIDFTMRQAMEKTQDKVLSDFAGFTEKQKKQQTDFEYSISENQSKLASELAALEKALDNLKTSAISSVSEKLQGLEEKFDSDLQLSSTKLSEELTSWKSDFDSRLTALANRCEDERHLAETNFVEDFKNKIAGLQEKNREQLARISSDIAQTQTSVQNDIDKVRLDLNAFMEQYRDNLKKASSDSERALKEASAAYNEQISLQLEKKEKEILEDLQSFENGVASRQSTSTAAIDSALAEFNSWKEQIRHQMDESRSMFAEQLKGMHDSAAEKLSEARSMMDRNLAAYSTENQEKLDGISAQIESLKLKSANLIKEFDEHSQTSRLEMQKMYEQMLKTTEDKVKLQNSEAEEKIRMLRAEIRSAGEDSQMRQSKLVLKIQADENDFQTRISELDKELKNIESQMQVYEKAEQMKKNLDQKIADLTNSFNKLELYHSDAQKLSEEYSSIIKMDNEMNEKLTRFNSGKTQIEGIEAKFEKLLNLSGSMDEKIKDLQSTSDDLQELQLSVRNFQNTLSGISDRYDRLEKKNDIIEQVAANVDRTFESLRELEQRLSSCSRQASSLPEEISEVQNNVDSILNNNGKIREAVTRLESLGNILEETEKKVDAIKNEREGIARTEARLQNLAREIDSKFNLLEKITKADLEKHPAKNNSGISPQDRESVKTLKRQGWTVAEIARSLNFPESAVELILEMPDD